jgi:tetratricopeptide (TPR) repeat protein
MGLAYYELGDFANQERYCVNSLEIEKKIYGESSPVLIRTYSILAIAYLQLQEYKKALEYSKIALEISGKNPGLADMTDMATIYTNLGVIYMRMADYTRAKVYLEKVESIYLLGHLEFTENFFNLLNNLAITYGFLGLSDKSNEYYEKGIDMAFSYNSSLGYNYINSYAIALGKSGLKDKGEALLNGAVERAKVKLGENSSGYFVVLFNYAEYLREFKIDNDKALKYY